MKIGVLLGGESSEREISIASGKAIANALIRKGYDIKEIDGTLSNVNQIKPSEFDVIFIALHGGDGENGCVQGILEQKGIIYTGSDAKASRLGFDKAACKELCLEKGIFTAPYLVFSRNDCIKQASLEKFLPFIVKPRFQGSSVGLSLVREINEFDKAIANAFSYDSDIIVESYIEGRELTVGVLGHEALPIVEIIPCHDIFDFYCKYNKGQTKYVVPAGIEKKIADRIKDIALQVFDLVGSRDYARVDFMLNQNNDAYVLEINTIPGFTETSLLPKAAQAHGIVFDDLCERIIKDKRSVLCLEKEK